jgi:diguanylate cyclase (GGDEF)-like protein
MTPDAATVIAYSAGLFALIFVFFLFSSRGKPEQAWYGLPFGFGSLAAILLVYPAGLPELWGPRLAVFCVLLAYGAAWQIARVTSGRKPLLLASLVPCAVWLGFSSAFVHDLQGWPEVVSAITRTILVAAFNGLAAREFWRPQQEQLRSATLLWRVFAVFAGFHFLRALSVVWLPAPLGIAPPEIWAVAVYNLAVVAEALLASAFIIALLRETVAAENHRLAFQDVMTGVGNRRAFQVKILEYADQKDPQGLALIVFDIDRFKSINDRFGHAYGDLVIIRAAEVAKKVVRRPDLIFRVGGEEFACLIADATEREAFAIGERLRKTFEEEAYLIGTIAVAATISLGVAARRTFTDVATLLDRADEALYSAKEAGRNRVAAASLVTAPALRTE